MRSGPREPRLRRPLKLPPPPRPRRRRWSPRWRGRRRLRLQARSAPAPGALPRNTTSIPPRSPVPVRPAGPRRGPAQAVFRISASVLSGQQAHRGGHGGGEGSGTAGMVLSTDLVHPATRMSGIRATIARRMRESLATTAQYTLHTSANAGGLLLMRAKIKAATGVPDININDLVTFCAIQALIQVPDVNVEFIDGKFTSTARFISALPCDTPRGLMVPVVRDAHKLTAGDLSVKMKELTAQAVKAQFSPDDLSAPPSPSATSAVWESSPYAGA